MPLNRTWILLFPEGGFLRKRREISRKFALQNSLPILHHTTIPRVGAVQNVVATIGPQRARNVTNGNLSRKCPMCFPFDLTGRTVRWPPAFLVLFWFLAADWADSSLKWIIDLTIAYPNGNPLDILTIFMASAPPCSTIFHYRCYPIAEVIRLYDFQRPPFVKMYLILISFYCPGAHGQRVAEAVGLRSIHREGNAAGHLLRDWQIPGSPPTRRVLPPTPSTSRRIPYRHSSRPLHHVHSVPLEPADIALLFDFLKYWGDMVSPTCSSHIAFFFSLIFVFC